MKTLAFVDAQNLFFGLKRVTGIPDARMDYVRLRRQLGTSDEDTWFCYVVTAVYSQGDPRGGPRSDDGFVSFLKKQCGFEVRRYYSRASIDDQGEVSFARTDYAAEMVFDAIRYLDTHDQLLIVSGSGATIPVARRAVGKGKPVLVACFEHAGDLNRELREMATTVYPLDGSYRFKGRS